MELDVLREEPPAGSFRAFRVEDLSGLPDDLDVLLRHRLPRESDRFEGILLAQNVVYAHDPRSLEGEQHEGLQIDLEAAHFARTALDHTRQDGVANRPQVLLLKCVALPLREKASREVPESLEAQEDAKFRKL